MVYHGGHMKKMKIQVSFFNGENHHQAVDDNGWNSAVFHLAMDQDIWWNMLITSPMTGSRVAEIPQSTSPEKKTPAFDKHVPSSLYMCGMYIYVCLYIHITYIYIHMHIIYTKYITYTYANTYIYCKHLYTFVSSIRAKAAQVWWGHPRHFACECAVEDGTEGGLTRVAHICSNYCTGIWKFYLEWIANTTATRSFFWIHDGSENHSSEFLWASTRSALTDGSIIQRKLRVAIFITWAFFVRKQSQGPWASDVWA